MTRNEHEVDWLFLQLDHALLDGYAAAAHGGTDAVGSAMGGAQQQAGAAHLDTLRDVPGAFL